MNATVFMNGVSVGQALIGLRGDDQRIRAMALRLDGVRDGAAFAHLTYDHHFDFVTKEGTHDGYSYKNGSLWINDGIVWGTHCEFVRDN